MAENSSTEQPAIFERNYITPQSPYPGTPDGSLPIEYQIILDLLETLTYVAANANRIALGICVIGML